MFKFFSHFFICLALILLQTSVLPLHGGVKNGFDLLIIMVLFYSLSFDHPALLGVVFLLGCGVDSVSGAPPGLYTAVYLWICIGVWGIKRVVHPGNLIFLPLISAAAVLLENAFLFFSFLVRHGSSAVTMAELILAGRQALWAALLIPVALIVIETIHAKCDAMDAGNI